MNGGGIWRGEFGVVALTPGMHFFFGADQFQPIGHFFITSAGMSLTVPTGAPLGLGIPTGALGTHVPACRFVPSGHEHQPMPFASLFHVMAFGQVVHSFVE